MDSSAADVRLVLVTCAPGGARELLSALVAERLVACGNIIPGVRSLYWWKGEVCDEEEEVVLMETAADRAADLEKRIVELHPYEVPKILFVEPQAGLPSYLSWVIESTRSSR